MLTNSCKNFYPCHKVCHRMAPNLWRKILPLNKSLRALVEDQLPPLGFILTFYKDIPLRKRQIFFFPAGKSIWGFDQCNDRIGYTTMH